MVGSLINIYHALLKPGLVFGWEKSKMSVDPIPEPGWYENIGEGPELVPSTGQKIPIQPGWYLPLQKIWLAENRFLQGGKGS